MPYENLKFRARESNSCFLCQFANGTLRVMDISLSAQNCPNWKTHQETDLTLYLTTCPVTFLTKISFSRPISYGGYVPGVSDPDIAGSCNSLRSIFNGELSKKYTFQNLAYVIVYDFRDGTQHHLHNIDRRTKCLQCLVQLLLIHVGEYMGYDFFRDYVW